MFNLDGGSSAAGHRLASLARSAQSTSLEVIKSVDATVDELVRIESLMVGLAKLLAQFIDNTEAQAVQIGEYLDPEDEAVDALQDTEKHLKDFLALLVLKKGAIDCDSALKDHHCEALHDAYELTCTSVAELIPLVGSVRTTVIRHDLAAEPRDEGEAFNNAEDLIANLRGS